ncbi:MAG: hypothetical protein ACRD6W_12995, partial [Nitrososphaerales archaeon]
WATLLAEMFGSDEMPEDELAQHTRDVFAETLIEIEVRNDWSTATHQTVLQGFDRALEVLTNYLGVER